MDWDAVINDALFAMKTSAYLGSFGNMNLSNDVALQCNPEAFLILVHFTQEKRSGAL